jgi:hypothetical protein
MKTTIITILLVLCASVILFASWPRLAVAGPDEKPGPIAESYKPKADQPVKEDSPAEKAKTNTPDKKVTSEKPALNEKSTDFEELPEFYKQCEDVLSKYVNKKGQVDYAKLRRKRRELFSAVSAIQQVEPLEYMVMSEDEKIAFWINAYNFFTLKLVIDNYPIKARWFMVNFPKNCIMQIPKGRDDRYFKIIDLEYKIRQIEHEVLMGLFGDLRIIFALTYASNSGAFLSNHAYIPSKLDEQLDKQVRRFLSSDRGLKIDKKNNIVHISSVFGLYKKYFVASEYSKIKKFREHPEHIRAYLNFIYQHASKENRAYLKSNDFTVRFLQYDWHLNEPATK